MVLQLGLSAAHSSTDFFGTSWASESNFPSAEEELVTYL